MKLEFYFMVHIISEKNYYRFLLKENEHQTELTYFLRIIRN